MATKMFEVQQKIYEAVSSSTDLKNMGIVIYDYVPEDTPAPYITFGQILSSSDITKTTQGEKLNFILDIWSENKGRKEAVTILTFAEKSLETEFVLSTASVIQQKVINRDVVEESYGLYHATLELQLNLVWEE